MTQTGQISRFSAAQSLANDFPHRWEIWRPLVEGITNVAVYTLRWKTTKVFTSMN